MPKTSSPNIQIVRMTGMYGCVERIKAMRDGKVIGNAVFDAAVRGRGPVWFIGASGRDDLSHELDFDQTTTIEANLTAVERILRRLVAVAGLEVA